jgi:drug/metabolite transporter (DMT)-like permease
MDSRAFRLGDFVAVALVPLFFATNVVIGRFVAAEVAPWTLAFLRWTTAFLIMLPFAVPGIRGNLARIRLEARQILLLGFLGMFICGGVVYLALHHTTAANATLIYTSSNVMVLLLEWGFRGRRIGLREWIGTALALSGVVIVALGSEGWRPTLNPGDALIAVAALAWAVYSVSLKRPSLSRIPGSTLFLSIMAAGAIMLLPMTLWELASGPALPQTSRAWMAVAAVALIPSVGAYSGYQYGVRRFGPTKMAMSSYLWTPYGLLLSVLFLGETLHAYHFIGLALILPGVLLATARLPPRRAA